MRCLIGIDDDNLIEEVKGYLHKIEKFIYIESTSNLETVQKLLIENDYDFMIASCCQHQDYSQKLLGWIRVKKIDVEVIYATRYNDPVHIQQAFRYGVCDYLLLPLDFQRFSLAIKRVIERILFMNSQKQFNQKEIDDYISLNGMIYSENRESKTGINNTTLSKVVNYLETIDTPFTADELAEKIGLSRVTTRRYLECMVDEGLLQTKMEYGKIGRPQKQYKKREKRQT